MGILKKVMGIIKMAKRKWDAYTYKQKVNSYNNLVNRLKRAGYSVQQLIEDVSQVDGFIPRESGRITEKMGIDEKAIESAINTLPTVKEVELEKARRDAEILAAAREHARITAVKADLDTEAEEIWDWYNSAEGAMANTVNKNVNELLRDLGYKYRYGQIDDAKAFFDYGMDFLVKNGYIKPKGE